MTQSHDNQSKIKQMPTNLYICKGLMLLTIKLENSAVWYNDSDADLPVSCVTIEGFLVTADNCVHVGELPTFTDLTFP